MASTAGYAVEVNECGIFATGLGEDWWVTNVLMGPMASRLIFLFIGPGGGLAQIPCSDREEAAFVLGHLISHGIHARHARVRRIAVPGREAA
jgi:hypothetical protein